MVNTAQKSIWSVLEDRRKDLKLRMVAAVFLAAMYGSTLGWRPLMTLLALYIFIQWVEVASFSGKAPWFREKTALARRVALAELFISAAMFGAPTLLLSRYLGGWGDLAAAYLLCGAMLNALLLSICCAGAFRASTYPYLVYMCILPFNSIAQTSQPSAGVKLTLIIGGIYQFAYASVLWRKWSRTKAAELAAIQTYMTERDANEKRLSLLSQQDSLTGLLNRGVLRARLANNAASAGTGTLLMIDLDGFKYVNDTLGHSAGDRVLCEVAKRISQRAGPADTAARLGGDEFALLLPGLVDTGPALHAAEAVISDICEPVRLDDHLINIGASIGIAMHPLHGTDPEQLFANADLALYQAKSEGRRCARLYQPELRVLAQGKVLRDSELRLALERGEFEMFYQPQVRLADGKVFGAEALLRWRHPEQGLLGPAQFLSPLEGGLLSADVGAWVIETACRQAAAWRGFGQPDFTMAVNIFGAQFRSGNLVTWVMQACTKSGLPPDALEIEITENVILRHEDDVVGPLRELRARGVGVAFDDFGTGFASLSMLTRFPVSRLKIDRSFTRALSESAAETAIIRAVIELAQTLDLQVTAEGIETEAQAKALLALGCAGGQGYYFGRPMPAQEFAARFGFAATREPSGMRAVV